MKLPAWISDPIIRHRVGLHRTPIRRFSVRVARTSDEYRDAFRLVWGAYVSLGIQTPAAADLRITEQHTLPEATVLVCYEGDRLVGTMTVTLDSPAGLPLQADYPEALAQLRAAGANLVEFGSLAVVERRRHAGVPGLLSLAAARLVREQLGATHIVVGVHPKAIAFYRAMWRFDVLGSPRQHAALAAPVVALVGNVSQMFRHIERTHRRRMSTGVTVAEHFLGAPLPCLELPPADLTPDELARWKLPRPVFRELFVEDSDRLATLSGPTRLHLHAHRSRDTLMGERLAPRLQGLSPHDGASAARAVRTRRAS